MYSFMPVVAKERRALKALASPTSVMGRLLRGEEIPVKVQHLKERFNGNRPWPKTTTPVHRGHFPR
jgi:hypothetical protein